MIVNFLQRLYRTSKKFSWPRIIAFGAVVWGTGTLTQLILKGLIIENQVLYYATWAVVVESVTIEVSIHYFREMNGDFVDHALAAGFMWLIISVVCNIFLVLSVSDTNILARLFEHSAIYFVIPVITTGLALFSRERKK